MSWQTRSTKTVYENPWISVTESAVIRPDGDDGVYGVVHLREAVFIVALDDDDRVALVTVDRYTVGPSIEIPAGSGDGQDPLVAAKRELAEETGLAASEWTPIGSMTALNGIARAPEQVFLARGLSAATDATASQREEGISAVQFVPFDEVLDMIADGRITDGESIASIAYAALHLRKLGS